MSSAGRDVSSSGCVTKPKERETGLTGFAAQIRPSSLTGLYAMATAEHREPYESRGSRTVLGAPGGESPLGDSTQAELSGIWCRPRIVPFASTRPGRRLPSEAFLEGPQVDFLRPGRPRLAVDLPIGLGDGVDAEQPVGTALLDQLRPAAEQPLAGNAAVDDDMGDMKALRPIVARHALRDHAQAGLRGGEMREAGLAAQAGR